MAMDPAGDSRRNLVIEETISTHDAGGESDKTGSQTVSKPLHEPATTAGSTQGPFLHFSNETNSPSQFKLHPRNPPNSTYDAYGTTLTLVVLLHMIYLYQWNRRRSRSTFAQITINWLTRGNTTGRLWRYAVTLRLVTLLFRRGQQMLTESTTKSRQVPTLRPPLKAREFVVDSEDCLRLCVDFRDPWCKGNFPACLFWPTRRTSYGK